MATLFVPSCSTDLLHFRIDYTREGDYFFKKLNRGSALFKASDRKRSNSWDSQISNVSESTSFKSSSPLPQPLSDQTPSKKSSNWKYKCTICKKPFERPSTLKTHLNSHTGERPFKCPHRLCERSFTVRSNMIRHHKKCRPYYTVQ